MHINGLSAVADNYDGFIFDLWGVVHDGIALYPGTRHVFDRLKMMNRPVCLLSNAPRLSCSVAERMAEMGLAPAMYNGIVTSGDAGRAALKNRLLKEWGRRCYYIGPAHNAEIYEGLDIQIVAHPEEADFALNSGVFDNDETGKSYRMELEACRAANLPMLCANPDKIVHVGARRVMCPGTLAETYENLGGSVAYFGKPYRDVYDTCFDILGTKKILAIGDSMATDIRGAQGAGIDSVLITGGIHRDENLEDVLKQFATEPTYALPELVW